MSRKKQKRKRSKTTRSGVLYCCGHCGFYSVRREGETERSMWSPCPSVTPVTRTCDDCYKGLYT